MSKNRKSSNLVNVLATDDSTGNVGIGTTSTLAKLNVDGGAASTTTPTMAITQGGGSAYALIAGAGDPYHGIVMRGYPDVASNYSIVPTDVMSFYEYGGEFRWYKKSNSTLLERMRIAPSGNLLIGTTTDAGYMLDVNGTGRFSGNVITGSTTSGAQINVFSSSYGNNGLFNAYGTDGLLKLQMGGLGANEAFFYTGASNKLSFFSGGNLSLTLASTGAATFYSSVTANTGTSGVGLIVKNDTNSRLMQIGYTSGGNYNYIQVYDGSSFQPLVLNNALTLASTGAATFSSSVTAGGNIESQGQIILQTNTSPSGQGQIGYNGSGGLYFFPKAGSSLDLNFYNSAGNQVFYVPTNTTNTIFSGNVGIGTASPGTNLHVKGAGAYTGIRADNTGTTGGGYFAAYQNGSQIGIVGVSGAVIGDTSSNMALFSETGKSIDFMSGGAAGIRMRIASGGNVLIGTTTDASSKLQVNGDVRASMYKTSNSSVTATAGVATTLFTAPALSLILVTVFDPSSNGNRAAFVWTTTSSGTVFALTGNTASTITVSGLNIQFTSTAGGTFKFTYTIFANNALL